MLARRVSRADMALRDAPHRENGQVRVGGGQSGLSAHVVRRTDPPTFFPSCAWARRAHSTGA